MKAATQVKKGQEITVVATRAGKERTYTGTVVKGGKVNAAKVTISVILNAGKNYLLEGHNGEFTVTNHADTGRNTLAVGGAIYA